MQRKKKTHHYQQEESSLSWCLISMMQKLQSICLDFFLSVINTSQSIEQKSTATLVPVSAKYISDATHHQNKLYLLGKNTEVIKLIYLEDQEREMNPIRFYLTILEDESCFILLLDSSDPIVVHEYEFFDGRKIVLKKKKQDGGIKGIIKIDQHDDYYTCSIELTLSSQRNQRKNAQVGIVASIDTNGNKNVYEYPHTETCISDELSLTTVMKRGKDALAGKGN